MVKTRFQGMKSVAAVAIGFLIAGVSVTAASAATTSAAVDEVCVPSPGQEYVAPTYEEQVVTEAGWQRYSWTGGPHEEDGAPAFPGAAGDWQANVAGDPHRVGLAGAYFRSNGNSGNGDWFYLEAIPEVTEMVMTDPGQPYIAPVVCEDPEPVKVWVCKYVGTPGVDETLKVGNDGLIEVSANTLSDQEVIVGASFPDEHGRSLVVQIGGDRPDPSICPVDLTEVTALAAVAGPPICGPDNDTVTIPTTEGVMYSDTGWVEGERTITATADEGYVLTGTTSWTFTDDATLCPIEVTAVAASVVGPPICGPNNDTVTIPTTEGVMYSDTGWVDGERTITATADEGYVLTGTDSWTFTDDATLCPIEITDVSVTTAEVPICGPNNDPVNIPEVEGLTFEDTGWVDNERTITAVADEGYVLDGQSEWTFYDEATPCPVTTVAPTVVAKCFPNNDTVTIPEVEGVVYSDTGWVGGERTITAAADEGYEITGDTSWTFTDVPSAACPPVGPVFAADELAFTGTSSNTGGFVALAILLITSGTALVSRKRRAF